MLLNLSELGYERSYDRAATFSRQWKVGQMERVKSASTARPMLMEEICCEDANLP